MAVKENNGLIYGVGKVMFNGKEIGWVSQDGLQPKGEAKQTTPVYAAQVHDGPVDELVSTPSTIAFGFKLIQLIPEMCKDLFGGTISSVDGAYEAPEGFKDLEGAFKVECVSGHTIEIPRARLSGELADSINMSGVLSYDCTVKCLKPTEAGKARYRIVPPQTEAEG
ncbi:MAG: hypothetical protein EGQ20_15095 [Bacteroides oleiciplenus]|jgi:hypothetical protein|uniref:Phage tail protein n=1 Tax=Bacteroides intestinalis TaxID=329854 RepID=A0A412Y2G2_9BACE|nr:MULTISPECIES: hypothetical protein [Bacteroides]MBD9093836.1 hypothetical protein [Bacteroides oleiciplenus]DAG95026.1 MAG TPA: GW (Gly-Tryp) dipeptide domain [Herelleviridae sp.]DAU42184.1 MAG TPA: GW (Gly-Tryp) dipeptide domain [Caudoviricetes sp.]RGV51625.1 hypothetical protein DWW10_16115 [Bacteroides intestinalis]RHA58060.1 hypothetical protein DW932_17475 [Bacteroides intestinalis]